MANVTLVAASMPNWEGFVRAANESLGRSPTRRLDAMGIKAGPAPSYIAALGEFQARGTNPSTFLREDAADDALDHVWASFLCACDRDTLLDVLEAGAGLQFLAGDGEQKDRAFLLSGTLRAWRAAVRRGCRRGASDGCHDLYSAALVEFDRLGMSEMFRKDHRSPSPDGTITLR